MKNQRKYSKYLMFTYITNDQFSKGKIIEDNKLNLYNIKQGWVKL